MAREFPHVRPDQVVIIYMDRSLGCVLNQRGEIAVAGVAEPLHLIFGGIEEARNHARQVTSEKPHIICVLHDSDGREIDYIG